MIYFNCRYHAEYHLVQCDKSVVSGFAVVATVLMRDLSLKLENLTLSFTLFQNLFNIDRQEVPFKFKILCKILALSRKEIPIGYKPSSYETIKI